MRSKQRWKKTNCEDLLQPASAVAGRYRIAPHPGPLPAKRGEGVYRRSPRPALAGRGRGPWRIRDAPPGRRTHACAERGGRGITSADDRCSRVETRSTPSLREQLFPGFRVLDEDRADRAVLGCLEDLLDRVAGGIDGFRLAVLIEAKHLGGDRLAHGIPDADVVVHPDAQLASH